MRRSMTRRVNKHHNPNQLLKLLLGYRVLQMRQLSLNQSFFLCMVERQDVAKQ